MSDYAAIVIDCGSAVCRAGFSGDNAPRAVFPSVFGKPKYEERFLGYSIKNGFVGDEAARRRGMLDISYPMRRGIIQDWKKKERILHHIPYNELATTPEEHHFLLTELPLNPNSQKEQMMEFMFETFNVPGLFISSPAFLASYPHPVGFFIDCGDQVTHTIAVYDWKVIKQSVLRQDFGGENVTLFIAKTLNSRGFSFHTSGDIFTVKNMKEEAGFFVSKYSESIQRAEAQENYELPDGAQISLLDELFKAPEILFDPSIVESESLGLHELVIKGIMNCPEELRADLFSNIYLIGGSTMFFGIKERLECEIKAVFPNRIVRVIANPDRKYSSWIGGSQFSSQHAIDKAWITKDIYMEEGPDSLPEIV